MKKNEFRSKLLRLVLPIAVQQFMVSPIGFTDALMLGFLNQNSLSAVSLAGQVQFVFSLFIFSITGGISILAAQYWGKGDRDAAEKVLGIGAGLAVLISLPFTLGAFFLPEQIMKCFASDPKLISAGALYLRAVSPSYLMLGISQPYLCIMKNCGQAGRSSFASTASGLLNVLLNWLLIFGVGFFPRLEVRGAAAATVISKAIELGCVFVFAAGKGSVRFRIANIIRTDRLLLKDYGKYTLPLIGTNLVWGMGFTMYSVIMGHLGSDAAAANSIANIVKNIAICVCEGIAAASAVIIGTELGGGFIRRAKKYGAKLCRISFISGVVSGGVILCVIPVVPLIPTLSREARTLLVSMLVVSSVYVVCKAVNMTVISGILPAGGDSKFGLKCDGAAMWCAAVPLGLAAAFVLKLPAAAVYAIINTDELLKLPAAYFHYKKYLWLNDLTRNN